MVPETEQYFRRKPIFTMMPFMESNVLYMIKSVKEADVSVGTFVAKSQFNQICSHR